MAAISITDTYDALLSTTLAYRTRQLWDNLTDAVTLFKIVQGIQSTHAGHRLEFPLLYGSNTTVESRGDYDTIDMTKQDGITMGYIGWRDLSGSIVISERERAQNSGREQVVSLLESKFKQLEVTFRNTLNSHLFADGTANAHRLQGLPYWLSTSTGTVAGINDATNTWWQNQSQTSIGSFASNGRDKWRTLRNDCSLGMTNDQVTHIVTTQTVYEAYEKTLEAAERLSIDSRPGIVDPIPEGLKFGAARVYWDDDCTSQTAYFLNTRDQKISFTTLPGHNMKMSPMRHPVNQRVEGAILTLTGNLCFKARRTSGIANGITA